MDAVLENIERQFLAGRMRTSDSVGHRGRQRLQSSFGSAFWALLFALGFPLAVFIFGSIRAREFQLTADPRWVRFAPFMSTHNRPTQTIAKSPTHQEMGRIPVQTASIRTDELPPTAVERHPLVDQDMTGSVSGHRSIEVSIPGDRITGSDVQSSDAVSLEQYEPRDRSERRIVGYRNNDLEAASNTLKSTIRIESQIKHVRQRLEQLAELQHQHHAADSHQQAQILEQQNQLLHREAELSIALNELSRNINDNDSIDDSDKIRRNVDFSPRFLRDSGSSSAEAHVTKDFVGHVSIPSVGRPIMNNEMNGEPSFAVSPADNAVENSSENETIRIRRDVGRDHADVFTMKVQEADIRRFFTKLSEVARVGILPSPAVQGHISLHLHEVRLEAALKAIVKSRDYVVEREHGIFVIRTAEEVGKSKPAANGRLALKADGSK